MKPPTSTPSQALLAVEQVDRDFAARWCGYGPETNDRIRAGECDCTPGVQAAANHRLAALNARRSRPTEGEVETREQRSERKNKEALAALEAGWAANRRDADCPACGGTMRIGPFFEGGLSSICGGSAHYHRGTPPIPDTGTDALPAGEDEPVRDIAVRLLLDELHPAHAEQCRNGRRQLEGNTVPATSALDAICNALAYTPSIAAVTEGERLREAVARLEKDLRVERRRATDAEYMRDAAVQMLGPTGLKVWRSWQDKGVQRFHCSWGPGAAELTGEERAQTILDMDAAPRQLIDSIDGHLAALQVQP